MGKRGRPRKDAGPREPNGRASRRRDHVEQQQIEGLTDVLETRIRHYPNLIENEIRRRRAAALANGRAERDMPDRLDVARDDRLSTVVGRWRMQNTLSEPQYQAAIQYAKDATAYSIAMNGPSPDSALDMNTVRGFAADPDVTAERDRRAKATFEAALKVVMETTMLHSGNVGEALALVVLRGLDYPRMIGEVRTGLNALAHHYKIVNERRAG